MKYLISWICWKNSCFFQIFLKFYFKKLVADIKTWSKNIIKLDSIFVLGTRFFLTKRPIFYWQCISRGIYTLWLKYTDYMFTYESFWIYSVSKNLEGGPKANLTLLYMVYFPTYSTWGWLMTSHPKHILSRSLENFYS